LVQAVPLISVIIPHFKQPRQLSRCLSSLHEQKFDLDRVEIIVVDNGSSELPTQACAQFANVRLEQETVPGPGPARNKGAKLSRGEVLAFIDADCIADENWLSTIATTLDATTQIIGGDVRIAAANPQKLTPLEAFESIFAFRQQEYIERYGFSGTGNLAMWRTVYDAVGPFGGIRIAEDREWGRRARSLGFSVRYVPDMLVYHPARQSFSELRTKSDRLITHDFFDYAQTPAGFLRWAFRALAVGASPAFEIGRILTSTRVSTWRARSLAMLVLFRHRFYRMTKMLQFCFRARRDRSIGPWNRSG
jgi:glycosyltransferase involved in cell wall biosynthesis